MFIQSFIPIHSLTYPICKAILTICKAMLTILNPVYTAKYTYLNCHTQVPRYLHSHACKFVPICIAMHTCRHILYLNNNILQASESSTRRKRRPHPTCSPSCHPSPSTSGSTQRRRTLPPRSSCSSWQGEVSRSVIFRPLPIVYR